MKIIFILCGLLWIVYGLGFLALSASVVSAPTHLMTLRNISYIIIGIFFVAGIYFIKTGMNENKKKIHKLCSRSFYKLMIKNKYKMHISEFANKMNIRVDQAAEYIGTRKKITEGILSFSDSGHIIISKYNANKK
ncbi:MAG: hypothetical protein EPN82_12015 [Bacteroidetes bacterium]|nr:MAG: hypothetical protein EPN82_12015 [Bacteroidota bacterium]